MCCLVAAPVVEPCCFGGSGAGEGTVGLLCSACCITSSVLQPCVGANRLAGGGGVNSSLQRERWWWWWRRRRRRRVEVLIYHRPSLLFRGTLSSYWEFASFRTRLSHLGSHTILTVLSTELVIFLMLFMLHLTLSPPLHLSSLYFVL